MRKGADVGPNAWNYDHTVVHSALVFEAAETYVSSHIGAKAYHAN